MDDHFLISCSLRYNGYRDCVNVLSHVITYELDVQKRGMGITATRVSLPHLSPLQLGPGGDYVDIAMELF